MFYSKLVHIGLIEPSIMIVILKECQINDYVRYNPNFSKTQQNIKSEPFISDQKYTNP